MKLELVRDWMTRDVVTISPGGSLPEAKQLMQEHEIRRLMVVENGRLTGILTVNDLRRAFANDPSQTVADIAAADPITVGADNTIGLAAQLMLNNKISGLPVLDNEQSLIGIITESDIFRLVVHDWMHSQDDFSAPFAHYGSK